VVRAVKALFAILEHGNPNELN